MSLVSLDQGLAHLRADAGDEDDLIALYLGAAEQSVVDYLNRQVFADQAAMDAAVTAGTAGLHPMVTNKAVEAAILMTLGHLYANREQVAIGVSVAEMPFGPRSLLRPHRIFPGF
ncbi:head-tail connector protein [Acidovorax sp. NCPPB 3576]|uniref:head-tail connector protein n=1 Tax=Acidovorax sp. NCPPB 3576 TaxID=2940488 RepID=UPI00234B5C8C|nr:head-tail connector protein [Acidovorax sp. NCPPB 3576]WCM88842.1 head-tail connector protein [Acidovorax sp. NCPPB 3576]